MRSIHNEVKSISAERFIRKLKYKIYKYMTSVSKNVYIDQLDDMVGEYNNTYHRTIKMKSIDVKDNTYIDYSLGEGCFIMMFFIKMSDSAYLTYYQRNRDMILNRSKDCYEHDKERLRKQARDECRNLSKEEKSKTDEYEKHRYRNMSEEKKKRLEEYQKIIAR